MVCYLLSSNRQLCEDYNCTAWERYEWACDDFTSFAFTEPLRYDRLRTSDGSKRVLQEVHRNTLQWTASVASAITACREQHELCYLLTRIAVRQSRFHCRFKLTALRCQSGVAIIEWVLWRWSSYCERMEHSSFCATAARCQRLYMIGNVRWPRRTIAPGSERCYDAMQRCIVASLHRHRVCLASHRNVATSYRNINHGPSRI